MARKTVLVVGMLDSVHLARWLSLTSDDVDFLLFPSGPNRTIHKDLLSWMRSDNRVGKVEIYSHHRFVSLVLAPIKMFMGMELRHILLLKLLKSNQVEIIHAFETQHAGYLAERTLREIKGLKPRLFLSNYGSDIFWFRRFSSHRKKLSRLIPMVDKYICECSRDVNLAKDFGLRTEDVLVTPNSGGIQILPGEKTVERDVIMIKGYQSWSGQAIKALQALWTLRNEIHGYRLIAFSCNWPTRLGAKLLSVFSRLKIKTYAKGALTHSQMLDLFAESAIYLGVSRTDGISTSAIESMAMGSIPVQSGSSCSAEWFEDGYSGFSLSDNRISTIREGVFSALIASKDKKRRVKNIEIIRSRYMQDVLREKLVGIYS